MALSYIEKFIGIPYIWGGSHPSQGFDCSGLVIEVLQGVGVINRKMDMTAAGLYSTFSANLIKDPQPGCLAFWKNTHGIISHVEMVVALIPDALTIGASGGDSTTISKDVAIKQGAFVKLRPLRQGWYNLVDPFA